MANLSGQHLFSPPRVQGKDTQAVNEWDGRVQTMLPGQLTAPRNTLRGHPQPWRTRPSTAPIGELTGTVELPYGRSRIGSRPGDPDYLGATSSGIGKDSVGGIHPGPRIGQNNTWSTAATPIHEWQHRVNTAPGSLRGSLAPNWKPLQQADETATGSVHLGTASFDLATATMTFKRVPMELKGRQYDAGYKQTTWSTAAADKPEWEHRVDEQRVGYSLR